MPRILVTGASGFLGRHIVAALAKAGHEPVALSRSGAEIPGAAMSLTCDLLDGEAMRAAISEARAETLIHCAWEADPRQRWHSLSNLDWLAASIALARAFAEQGGKHFLFVGSCAEYDWSQPVLSEETTPLNPATLYGAAKAATGIALGGAAAALGVRFTWARVFFCYGPGEPKGRLVRDVIDGLSAGQRVPCSDGLQQRDFLHVADIGAALALLAASDFSGPVNIASGTAVAVRDVISEVAAHTGNAALVDLGALARAPGDPPCLVGDVGRLAALGFRPRFSLREGIRDTVEAITNARPS